MLTDILFANQDGDTPLLFACRNTYPALVVLLLANGANARASNNVCDALLFFLCVWLTIMCTQAGEGPADVASDEAVRAAFHQHTAWKRRSLVIMIRATRRDVYRMQAGVATAYDLSSAVSNCCLTHSSPCTYRCQRAVTHYAALVAVNPERDAAKEAEATAAKAQRAAQQVPPEPHAAWCCVSSLVYVRLRSSYLVHTV